MRVPNADHLAPLAKVFEQIGLAKFSTSAAEAREMGFLAATDRIIANRDQLIAEAKREALHLIGKTILKLPAGVKANESTPADVTVIHPNDTGFELNQVTVMYIPPHFVRSIKLSIGGRKLLDAELDFSVSENPTLRFHFVPHGDGELRAEVTDSKDGRYVGSLPVTAAM